MELGDFAGAEHAFREAIRLKPQSAVPHSNLSVALYEQGRFLEAVAASDEAIRLKPDFAGAHHNRGRALSKTGDIEQAIAALRTAVRLDPEYEVAYAQLGLALSTIGEFRETLKAFQRARALGYATTSKAGSIDDWIQTASDLAPLESLLDDYAAGRRKTLGTDERVGVAQVAYLKGRYLTAARLFITAFDEDPALMNKVPNLRYGAARAAAFAAWHKGKEKPEPSDEERSLFGRKALEWLKSELADCRTVLSARQPANRRSVATRLREWKVDPAFASFRNQSGLGTLPEEEAQRWRGLWAEVEDMLRFAVAEPKAGGSTSKELPADVFAR